MKILSILFSCLLIASSNYAAESLTTISSNGNTEIEYTGDIVSVIVKIRMYEIQIGNPSDGLPLKKISSCTYSKYPCSIVEDIDITVNHNSIYVPRSLFCDLSDINKAGIKSKENGIVLSLYGGDASESYIVKVEFDKTRVKRRTLFSSMIPDAPLQETFYYVQALD